MIDAIAQEIFLTKPYKENEKIETIYFGGGTPSLLNEDELGQLLLAIKHKFCIGTNAEITLEANPDDIAAQKLEQWRSLGINRLSIGIQTFDEAELKWMNRAHSAAQSLSCIDLAIKAGFNNFSIDLIYGSPLLDDEQWKKNIEFVIGKQVPHISAYALTVEAKTALDKMIQTGRSEPVDPEKQVRHYLILMEMLEQAGYEHYEISNFAKPGMRSLHNSSYWKNEPYYGFGPGAHSFDGQTRKWNFSNNPLYISTIKQDKIPSDEEVLTFTQMLNEYIMISLRTKEGLSLNFVSKKFGDQMKAAIEVAAEKWMGDGKLIEKDQYLILTTKGKLFADGIAADLFH